MIVADTSVWIDHLRTINPHMSMLLNDGVVLQHTFIVGELSVGNLPDRANTLAILRGIIRIPVPPEEKYYEFLERERLAGSGLGFVDINILAALDRQPGIRLWTRDKRLAEHATRLGFAYSAA